MLGKWSFGDYFKLQAMQYTLEWMTSKDWLGSIPRGCTSRTTSATRNRASCGSPRWAGRRTACSRLGDKDNLWAAGDVGPWGYDTEYFWDFAPDGLPLDTARFEALCESGRIVEIGNDVFMQFNRDDNGVVTELPMKNVDFGGGLERFAMVLQDAHRVYQTDCMDYLIRGFAEVLARCWPALPPARRSCSSWARRLQPVLAGRGPYPHRDAAAGRRRDPRQRRAQLRTAAADPAHHRAGLPPGCARAVHHASGRSRHRTAWAATTSS